MNLDDLQALIEEATRQAFEEKLGPLVENEDERAKQKKAAEDTKSLGSNKKAKDLDEAEDEEEKPSDKAALGKEETPEGDGDTPNAVMPTADDMAEADVGQIINMLNTVSYTHLRAHET